ncbi:MAG: HmuY family protein [Chitinophagales bacterium]|nr:HmuY family protein [Chitinophagales bacterium]
MRNRDSIANMIVMLCSITALSLFSSCFKEDNHVQLQTPGDAKVFQIGMGPDYHRQVYFDFNSTDTTGSEHTCWDLSFESSDSGWHVWINGSNEAFIANTDTQDFEAVTDTAGANWSIDNPDWDIDSTAAGDWRTLRMVYILDRGAAKLSGDRFKKIIFQSVSSTQYEVQYANLDGSGLIIYDIPKTAGNSFVYFTFDNGGEMKNIEPNNFFWDVLFTRYKTVFYTVVPPLPYLVTGILINPNISVSVDSSMSFADINYQIASSLSYSNKRDIIGYNWKYYDFSTQAYVVRPYYNYIIRDMEGVYWKLHFIDFYNSIGEKGYPQFEYQRL